MTHRHWRGCGPNGEFEFSIPEGLFAMRGGRGWGGNWGPIHFDFGDGSSGRGRRGRRRMFESGELRLVLLKLIADEPRHGYDLIRAIEELTGGLYVPSAGMVYPILTLLQDMGHIEEATPGGARKQFTATAEGTEHLAARRQEVEALFARLSELASARQRTDGGPIRRAMENLRAALMYRLNRDTVETETLHAAAAILDDAAQKIERL